MVYHETRGFCSFCDFSTKGDHKVDEDWELQRTSRSGNLARVPPARNGTAFSRITGRYPASLLDAISRACSITGGFRGSLSASLGREGQMGSARVGRLECGYNHGRE